VSSRIGLAPLALLAACGGGDPTATDPRLLFEDAFLNPPGEVEIVAEGGTMVRGVDAWLKLRPGITAPLKPRQAERYIPRDCSEPLAWFAKASGDSGLVAAEGDILCREAIDPRFEFENGRWLVADRTRGLVYYRIWKGY
jgi:hypothetical protein